MAEEEKTALVEAKNDLSVSNIEVTGYDIKGMIYVVRNQQVMIDSDLAMLYQVETGALNRAVKRNYTQKQTRLTKTDTENFNAQYPTLEVKYTKAFHDRFLILDRETAYHVGASLKDAGKKCFGISLIQDEGIIKDILQRLKLETEE